MDKYADHGSIKGDHISSYTFTEHYQYIGYLEIVVHLSGIINAFH